MVPKMNIQCAICSKAVDRWQVVRNDADMCLDVTAWCHGQVDECEVPLEFINEAGRPLGQISAIAFGGTKAIPPP